MRQMFIFFILSLVSIACFCCALTGKDDTKSQNPLVLLKTSKGDIKLELYLDKAPITVKNFLEYVNEGFYNHTIFHRVIDGFMIQGGGLTADMKVKPTHPSIKNEAENGLLNTRGTIAMARSSNVDSASSQFFINVSDNSFLNFRSKNPREYGYCVFGKVIDGMGVVDEIKKVKTGVKGLHENVPIESVEIIEAKELY